MDLTLTDGFPPSKSTDAKAVTGRLQANRHRGRPATVGHELSFADDSFWMRSTVLA